MIYNRGFALPTVLISSIIMMMVLLSGLTATSSSSVALRSLYEENVETTATKAGLQMAKACLAQNNGTPQWSSASPLKPNTNCSGVEQYACPSSSTDSRCFIVSDSTLKSTFEVSYTLESGTLSSLDSKGIVIKVGQTSRIESSRSDRTIKSNSPYKPVTGTKDSMSASVISPLKADAVSVGGSSSSVCATYQSNNQVYCTGYGSKPFGTTEVKDVSMSGASSSTSSVCGIYASNNQVYCTGYGSRPFGTTEVKDVSINGSSSTTSSVCGIYASNNQVYCISYGSKPFGTTEVKDVSIGSSSSSTSSVCGIYASNNQVYCTSYGSKPFGTTEVKDVSIGGSSSSVCGIYASNNQVYCTSYGSKPFGTTEVKDVSIGGSSSNVCVVYESDNQVYCISYGSKPFGTTSVGTEGGYNYCAIDTSYAVRCTKSNATSPFGSTSFVSVSVSRNDADGICAVYTSNKQIYCVDSFSASPFGSTQLDSISVGSSAGSTYTCGIYDSNSQGICTTNTTAQPFGSSQMKSIDIDTDGSTRRVCAIYKTTKGVNCVSGTIPSQPFGNIQVTDVAAASGEGAADNLVCVVYDSPSAYAGSAYCVADPSPGGSEKPLPGQKIIDISFGTKLSPRVCIIDYQQEAFCSLLYTDSPLAGSVYFRDNAASQIKMLIY
jgi:hypothetical protein